MVFRAAPWIRAGVALLAFCVPGFGQCLIRELRPFTDGQPHWVGDELAALGDRAVISGTSPDRAYVFDLRTGSNLLTLVPGDKKTKAWSSFAMSETSIVAGDWLRADKGAVYVFDAATGAQRYRLDGFEEGSHFGISVDVDDGVIAVGASAVSTFGGGTSTGTAFLFDEASGALLHRLRPKDLKPNDSFGAVAIDGGRVVVGAPSAESGANKKNGAVYVFDVATGAMLTKIPAPDPTLRGFGSPVVLRGNEALIGASFLRPVVFLYDITTGQEIRKFVGSDANSADGFGSAIAMNDEFVAIGAWYSSAFEYGGGAVYLYDKNTGEELHVWTAPDVEWASRFGIGVALSGRTLLVGAPTQYAEGAAYVFGVSADVGQPYCGPAVPNSTGLPGRLSATGMSVAICSPLVVTADQLPPGSFGFLLASQDQDFVPFSGGSQGTLCLGGTIGYFHDAVSDSRADGSFSVSVDLHAFPPPLPPAVQPGETWNFQAWYRDDNPGPTSNFTDGLTLMFQ